MKTTIVPIDTFAALEYAKSIINQDQVIAAPTDTVYGLMCRYDSITAISRIYEIKGRPAEKAIPILIGDREQLADIVRFPLDSRATLLMEKFWPGPLTLILPATTNLPNLLTAGQPTVAVRIPQHKHLQKLLNTIGPLAVTSANHSGQTETHSAAEVETQLGGLIPLILDDSQSEQKQRSTHKQSGIASTILALSTAKDTQSGETYRFLRSGPIHTEVKQALDEAAMNKPNSPADIANIASRARDITTEEESC